MFSQGKELLRKGIGFLPNGRLLPGLGEIMLPKLPLTLWRRASPLLPVGKSRAAIPEGGREVRSLRLVAAHDVPDSLLYAAGNLASAQEKQLRLVDDLGSRLLLVHG